jgi:hypothetical protein
MTAKTQLQAAFGSADGKFIFESMIAALQNKTAAKAA